MRPAIPSGALQAAVRAAIEEDLGSGDLTAESVVEDSRRARGAIEVLESGVLAGVGVALHVFRALDPEVEVLSSFEDGARLRGGETVLVLAGRARGLLSAERVALNFLGRLSGVATRTAEVVEAVAGTGVAVFDTRKTTPGLRALERYAVAVGGGRNHRSGLYDAVLLKSNHFALARDPDPQATTERARRAVPPGVPVMAEARTEAEARAVVLGGADLVLVDNAPPERLRRTIEAARAAAAARGKGVEVEASGGITAENARTYATAGVDRISLGSLTRSARSLDFRMTCVAEP